jgi:predicted secreted protein
MIKFRRGTTKSWRSATVKLASGQPGYDKDKHKIKVGDGEKSWADLPYASGLSAEEILNSETNAKTRKSKDPEDLTLITYGTEAPNRNTVGQVYLQQYEAEPEADYVVSSGVDGIWTYQLWRSGIAKCWGVYSLTTDVQTAFEGVGLFHDSNKMKSIAYPSTFEFKDSQTAVGLVTPTETATVQSPGGIVWLANKTKNTKKVSGVYTIISPDKQLTNAVYLISLQVEGFWK